MKIIQHHLPEIKMSKPISFEEFEQAVMQKLLEQDTPINTILYEQYKQATVVKRDFTGVGFFTDFIVPKTAPSITEPVAHGYGDVQCSINGIDCFGGFVLFIENGVMACLEGYSYGHEWPNIITSYHLSS